jgi:hypothetical protein
MSRWSSLFRALLCLALVLNGVGTAYAATGMQLSQHQHGNGTPQQAAGDHACHGQPAGTGEETPPEPRPSCCDGGICACACASFAHAMPAQPATTAAAWSNPTIPPALSPGYSSAALQRLVRPPIG